MGIRISGLIIFIIIFNATTKNEICHFLFFLPFLKIGSFFYCLMDSIRNRIFRYVDAILSMCFLYEPDNIIYVTMNNMLKIGFSLIWMAFGSSFFLHKIISIILLQISLHLRLTFSSYFRYKAGGQEAVLPCGETMC